MANICTSNLTSGFIDLATYDELEKYMYGGGDATAYFVRETRKSTWFTQVPVVLSRNAGSPEFNTEWSVSISRAGDYLLYTWLRITLPAIALVTPATSTATTGTYAIRWTQNVGHNLIRECCISFNDLVAARFDNYHMDFWAAFTVPASKQVGYNNMIGNVPQLTGEGLVSTGLIYSWPITSLPSYTLNVPLPFFFARDSGIALPTAALPYNEMRIQFQFRDWRELLIVDSLTPLGLQSRPVVSGDVTVSPSLNNGVNVFANYAIVSNDERKRMACAPRDILVEQCQTAPRQTFAPATNPQPQYDIRFSHAIKVLFFAARNSSIQSEWSNYTTVQSYWSASSLVVGPTLSGGVDPIKECALIYENTYRLQQPSDYYSLVNPWFHAPTIPAITGYHTYSYSLDFYCLDPKGSTNYGKLTNVSLVPHSSDEAITFNTTAAGSVYTGDNWTVLGKQTYEFLTTVVNNNIIRISGGALGFPVL